MSTSENETPDTKPKRSLGRRLHDRFLAAEVAAEEAAGYGSVTAAVEAAESAVDPEHELGHAGSGNAAPAVSEDESPEA